MWQPGVAVVIPAYNPGEHLRRALDSVLQQVPEAEVIVVDDGGDEDLSWVDDLPVTRHRQSNAGVSTARNVGVSLTAAPLIAFLDQDDEWLPGKLARQIETIDEAVLSYTDFIWMPSGETARQGNSMTREWLARGGHFCLSSLLVRRDAFLAVGGFNPALAILQDYDLALRLLARGTASLVAEPLVRYWLHDSNGSSDYVRAMAERRVVLGSQRLLGVDVSAGMKSARALHGGQAWDAYLQSRDPRDAARAAAWAPRLVADQVAAKARRAIWQ